MLANPTKEHYTVADLLGRAYSLATHSKDKSSQNGAFIMGFDPRHADPALGPVMLGHGWNDIPEGVVVTEERQERPLKYDYTEHAERAAIFYAALGGHATWRTTMFCPWAACCDCARAIICAGISVLVVHKDRMDLTHGPWVDNCKKAIGMLGEKGVRVEYYSGPMPEDACVDAIRVDGQLWSPKTLKYVEVK